MNETLLTLCALAPHLIYIFPYLYPLRLSKASPLDSLDLCLIIRAILSCKMPFTGLHL